MKLENNTVVNEMKKHLNNILFDIDTIFVDNKNIYKKDNIDIIRFMVVDLISSFESKKNLSSINLKMLKKLSNMVYDLNFNNNFSAITDHISNELYAFEFLLQEEFKYLF